MNRQFLGTVVSSSNYRDILETEGKDKIRFHDKHLKAYLKGKDSFYHGYTIDADGNKIPTAHKVKEKLAD